MADTRLPRYNTAIAAMLDWPAVIKMRFPQVGMRFYPLRADLARLQRVCDSYLNFNADHADRPPVYFKPAAPFVLMQTVNYDKLEIDQIGWLRQHEAIFSIPLEWYELKGDSWVFRDWAMTYPFIYLDHPISIWMGREMYGWPKVPVRVPRLFPLRNPPDPQSRVDFNLATPSRDRPGRPEPFRPFIEVRQDPESLLTAVPRGIAGSLAAAATVTEALSGMITRERSAGGQCGSAVAMMRRGADYLSSWIPELLTMFAPCIQQGGGGEFTPSPFMKNNIVLKQFRDAHDIDSACYQALIKSEIAINRILGAGLLCNPLAGDFSGGVTIRLHHFDNQPIVETLGLEVIEMAADHGRSVASLKPFCPFWWNLDLSYGAASTICWRSRTTRFAPPGARGKHADRPNAYVTIGSGALEEVAGVQKFPDFLMRVMALRADRDVLRKLCAELFAGAPYVIEPAASYVLLIADEFRRMTTGAAPKQAWADSELQFALPARCRDRRERGPGQSIILPLIKFTGSEWNAISNREVNGRFALASDLVAPPAHGMQELPPGDGRAVRRLLSLRTSLCPTLDEDEQTRLWTLLDIEEDTAAAPAPDPATSLDQWLGDLALDRIKAENRFSSIALKQFRDAEDADAACYQALVRLDCTFAAAPQIAWIRERLKVRIYEFDSMQLVKKFGLLGGDAQIDRSGRPSVVFAPEAPFWVRAAMEQGLGVNLCWRAASMEWERG